MTCITTELPEDCRGRWESFVGETLRETNRRNTVDLVRNAFTHTFHCIGAGEKYWIFKFSQKSSVLTLLMHKFLNHKL